jgi:cyclopropane-fatty-acyl-phospholipid synthase
MTSATSPIFSKLIRRANLDGFGLALRLWNGDFLGSSKARVTISFKQPRSLGALLSSLKLLIWPTAGKLASAYVEKLIDIEGSPRDLVALGTSIGNVGVKLKMPELIGAFHTRSSDRKSIEFHYDVSNNFYALWLDQRMVYSCAYFRSADDSLDLAQEQKLEHICRKLRLQRGDRLLDIGCGWGGLILWAAKRYGARCVGITLSQRQFAWVNEKIREQGLEAYCEVRLMDYREIDPNERYDKIASVGMFEHVGRRNLGIYFNQIYQLLEPGGLLLNHGISASWSKGKNLGSDLSQFIDRYVFPDGELVPVDETLMEMRSASLEPIDVETLRSHYAKTLWHWVARLDRSADQAREMVGDRAYRIWRIYMAGSAYAFERGWISLHQVLAAKPHSDGQLSHPLTREHVYEKHPSGAQPVAS